MARRFKVSSRQTRVGIIICSSKQRRILSLTQARGRQSVYRALKRIRKLRGQRRTGRALYYAKRYLFVGKTTVW